MYYIDVLHSNMTFEEINLHKFKISSFPENQNYYLFIN